MMGCNDEMMMRLVSVCCVGGYVGSCPPANKHVKHQHSYKVESQSSSTMDDLQMWYRLQLFNEYNPQPITATAARASLSEEFLTFVLHRIITISRSVGTTRFQIHCLCWQGEWEHHNDLLAFVFTNIYKFISTTICSASETLIISITKRNRVDWFDDLLAPIPCTLKGWNMAAFTPNTLFTKSKISTFACFCIICIINWSKCQK